MEKIELNILSLSQNVAESQSFVILLGEREIPRRRLPIIIAFDQAQSIHIALEGVSTIRPLTHELIRNVFGEFGVELREVIINNLRDGIFYSTLVLEKDGKTYQVDSRTSDALALAVRFHCPVYTYEFILDNAGVTMPEPEKEKRRTKHRNDLESHSLAKLQTMLDEAIGNEDYERAAKLRDEIDKRV